MGHAACAPPACLSPKDFKSDKKFGQASIYPSIQPPNQLHPGVAAIEAVKLILTSQTSPISGGRGSETTKYA